MIVLFYMEQNNQQINISTDKKYNRFTKWSLIIAIVIVANLFFNYAITLVFHAPEYEKFFPTTQIVEPITEKEKCLSVGGQWNEGQEYRNSSDGKTLPVKTTYCDPDYSKHIAYEKAHKSYEQKVFVILVLLGVLMLVFGIFISIPILGTAFAWSGVLSLLIASIRYWSLAQNGLKVLMLGGAFAVLIWVGVKKFGR